MAMDTPAKAMPTAAILAVNRTVGISSGVGSIGEVRTTPVMNKAVRIFIVTVRMRAAVGWHDGRQGQPGPAPRDHVVPPRGCAGRW